MKESIFKNKTDVQGYNRKPIIRVYKRRFYILTVYSLASILQVIVWNTWAPIAETSKYKIQTTVCSIKWGMEDCPLS